MAAVALSPDISVGIGEVKKAHPDAVTEGNWLALAMKHYDNPTCSSVEEFQEDMKRFKYIRKLLTQYDRGGELKERLILNHIIVLGNVLGPDVLVRILFLKMRDYSSALLPFLVLLNILPDTVWCVGIGGENIRTDEIPLDKRVVDALRTLIR